jgi:diaminopimelate epimerase
VVALPFWKVEATRNDFVLLDAKRALDEAGLRALAPLLCDRRSGIGADGILVVGREPAAWMRMWNPDGSEAETCGNGLRCVALWLAEAEGSTAWRRVRTRGGEVELRPDPDAGEVELIVPRPTVGADQDMELAGEALRWTRVDAGNPHAVIRTDRLDQLSVEALGEAAQERVAGGLNLEWARPDPGNAELRLRIWERGAGETESCGSGVVAAATVAWERGWLPRGPVCVVVPGGRIEVEPLPGAARLRVRGPARICYSGSWPVERTAALEAPP